MRDVLKACIFLLTALASSAGCNDTPLVEPPLSQTAGIARLTDLNDLPNVVEVFLVAGVGETHYLPSGAAQVWGYRDGAREDALVRVPGPLIEAKQGDRVVVHFRNELPEGTTIHWHGIRVPNAADGTPTTQVEVPPGGEFRYEFVARDEGTFWYHPHVRGDAQVERGLYGMLVVQGGPTVRVAAERALLLDDVKLNADGTLSSATTSLDIMLGRLGNFIVTNGMVGGALHVAGGSRERWRIVNTANGRYFNLRLPGHTFQVIGWDGGLLSRPYASETLLVAPGERYDVLVDLNGKNGSEIALETLHYDRGHEVPDPGPQRVLRLAFGSRAAQGPAPLPPVWGAPVDLEPTADTRQERLFLDEHPSPDGTDVRFTINDQAFPHGLTLEGREGQVAVWTIENRTEMDHPFHLHGMFFRVLDVNGTPPPWVGWKDTVNVPRKATLRFVVRYEDAGSWMFHCHILEHAERGMMGALMIRPPSTLGDASDPSGGPANSLDAGAPHDLLDASNAAQPGDAAAHL